MDEALMFAVELRSLVTVIGRLTIVTSQNLSDLQQVEVEADNGGHDQ